ncbi:MAG: citrate synthase [Acidimicrobiales bacterium]
MLETEEAARRLGVKRDTLYAYVSRGLLASHRSADGRRSLFDVADIERMARRSRGGRRVESRLATVTTAITQLREDGPAYRGLPAADLAGTSTFEQVAEVLWTSGGSPADADWGPAPLGPVPDLPTADRLRWAVVMAGARDPLRADLRPEAVMRAARRLIGSMVSVVGRADGGAPRGGTSVAGRLTAGLSASAPPGAADALDAALVLLADHELATSTVAVRVAASTRADLYDAVSAGLGTLGGPLHGGASQLAHSLLVDAERLGPDRALNEILRWQGMLPGFGHTVYQQGDPRAGVLLERFDDLATADRRRLVRAVVELAAAHEIPLPNVDLGLAALVWALDLPADAGHTIFAVARVAGWTAHYLEELAERPLRFRARAIYATAG